MHSTKLQCVYNTQISPTHLFCAAEQDAGKNCSVNSAMLHGALEQEAKKNVFIRDMGGEVRKAGCYRVHWTLARTSANTFVQTAVGVLAAMKFRLSVLHVILNKKTTFLALIVSVC